jgi:hypothetical protein
MLSTDEQLLSQIPDYISVGGLLKTTPSEEYGERFLYLEASNETVDYQDEIVLQKALSDSAEYFLRHGNIDLSHYTILGPKSGIPNFMEFEIGKPVDVALDYKRTFVKAQLYRGESPMAHNANMVWDSLTKQSPPSRWYPSVGGAVLSKSVKIDPKLKSKVAVIEKVRWNNVALDRCPANASVPEVSTIPVGVFTKSLGGYVIKTLEAGYGTDSASLTGGGALRRQSLYGAPISYFDFREKLSASVKSGQVKRVSARTLTEYAANHFDMEHDDAAKWVERFMRDLNKHFYGR